MSDDQSLQPPAEDNQRRMKPLPIITDCTDCGACCRMCPIPPFKPGETVQKDVPDDLLQPIRDRIAADQQFDLLPCVWFDQDTQKCRHYDFRPDGCRNFEVASDACRMARRQLGVEI